MEESSRLEGPEGEVLLGRGPDGVPLIEARGERDLAFAQGWLHARDRQVQLMFTRAVARGRLAECFSGSDEAVATDRFMRRLSLAHHVGAAVQELEPGTRRWLQDYADGVNTYLEGHWRRVEFLLTGYRPEPWVPADSLLTLQVVSYLGLAQAQQDIEKLLVQLIRRGADLDFLRHLFRPHLEGLDEDLLDLLRQVRVSEPRLTREWAPETRVPGLQASNNWVVAPSRSATGDALWATDPHLEVNRLPPVWYETVTRLPGDYRIGISMPGLPGLAMGRTRDLAFGFTYGCMDQVDYFLEDCREGQFRREDGWHDFHVRTEVIWRKGREPVLEEVFENELGVLEGDPRESGLYLLRAWAGLREGVGETFEAFRRFLGVDSVEAAQPELARVMTSCNWLLADREGHIGYQQSGVLPARRGSGLLPLPAWEPGNRWRGRVDPELLHRVLDPPEGVLATTNDFHQNPSGPLAINLSAGDYRAERIRGLLHSRERLTPEDLQDFQLDLYSVQAERYLDFLEPLLPPTRAAMQFKAWDCRYRLDSPEACWFEEIYQRLMGACFAELFGPENWDEMLATSGTLNDFHVLLDEAFLDPGFPWLEPAEKEERARQILEEVLEDPSPETWGQRNRIPMRHILLGGRLPEFLGFDLGPVPLAGGRATLCQGRIYRSHGRWTTFVPSWRCVTDLGGDLCRTALPGGVSDSRFSRWYSEGLARWLGGEYKHLEGSPLPGAPGEDSGEGER